MLDIYFYPGQKHTVNPYQELLARAIQKIAPGAKIELEAIYELRPNLFRSGPNRKIVVHIHWLPEFYPGRAGILRSTLRYWKVLAHFLAIISLKFWKGARVIWTVHHKNQWHLRPLWTSLFFYWAKKISDGYIFHCEKAREEFRSSTSKHWPMLGKSNFEKLSFVIPHGNFIGQYGPKIDDQKLARQNLGFPEEAVSFLIFGFVRESKQLRWLLPQLESFAAAEENQRMHFIIAGKPLLARDEKFISNYTGKKYFTCIPEFIPDQNLASLFGAADFLINAQLRGYVSGITIAALSYGLPVLHLNWGCAPSLINHEKNGLLFTKETFQAALNRAIEIKKNPDQYHRMREVAYQSMAVVSWENIARQTLKSYHAICGVRPR